VPRVRYTVARAEIVVTARSSVHDTTARWTTMTGAIEVDPADPAAGATALLTVDMRDFDAGDRLKNWKLKGDIEPDKYPEAVFTLAELRDVARAGDQNQKWNAAAPGTIRWRGREAMITAKGGATVAPAWISAECSFELDVRDLGVKPPKILMLKVEEIVHVTVRLEARAA
jgi:polyisoprenoid-binding protein YceI